MRRQFRHGMARRAAQWLPIHPRHGALRDVYRRAAKDLARGSRTETESEMAPAGRRRCRRDDTLITVAKGARRRARCVPDERRDALSRARLSRAHRAARVGGEYVGEMAAPDRGRRRAMASSRGDLEIHRPAGERKGAPFYVRDGRKVGDYKPEPAGSGQSQIGADCAVGDRLVRARKDLARRCLARRRAQLAHRADRRTGLGQGGHALLLRVRLGRRRTPAAVARHRRDRLRAAAQGCAAQDPRRELGLSQ